MEGGFGILNDIPSTYNYIKDAERYWNKTEIINVESTGNWHSGHIFGDTVDLDLDGFIEADDTVTITVDFMRNIITFDSTKRQSTSTKQLPAKVVRRLTEFNLGLMKSYCDLQFEVRHH